MKNNDILGKREVFCRFIRKKTGEVIYPKNASVFHFWVDDSVSADTGEAVQLSIFDLFPNL